MRQGLVLVNTGPGKGKTTAALGAALRAAGRGFNVAFLQFIKNRETGEQAALSLVPNIEFRQLGLGMFRNREPNEADIRQAQAAWLTCLDMAASGRYGLIVLDEICLALHYNLIALDQVLDFIRQKPPALHLILTGRYCPEPILSAADTVTWMEAKKHHFQAGIKSQEGIEY